MKSELTVILRIFLYAIAGRLTAGGWLPEGAAENPEFIEAVLGVLMFAGTAIWWRVAKIKDWAL